MGHDISAYNKDRSEIAYIRYGAWNEDARRIYSVLDCKEFDGGCSGLQGAKEFTMPELKKAWCECFKNAWDRECAFLQLCIDYFLKEDLHEVLITFY